MADPITIIRPGPEFTDELTRLGASTYAETFTGVNYYTKDIVDGYVANTFTPERVRRDLLDPKHQFLIIKVGNATAGFAQLVEREPAACIKHLHAIYLNRIYFAKGFQRMGLGSRLLAAAYREARARGYERLWLSVWEHNTPAVTFYQKKGYKRAGEWDWVYESQGKRMVDKDWIYTVDLPPLAELPPHA